MRKLYISLIAFLFALTAHAQTTLISPTGDGGFETGATFAANGWTVVNGSVTNKWFVGTVATPSAGTNSAYVSSDVAGATYTYNLSAVSVVHFYRDVTFPAGETNIQLSFKYKSGGESSWDWMVVWSAPTTQTPAVNTPTAGSTSWNNIPTSYPGATLHGTQPYNLNSTYQTINLCFPASFAGTTRRLVFTWSNDGSLGAQPPVSIDEISLISSTPPIPSSQPTALVLTPISSSQIDGSFTAAAGASGYVVVRYPFGATPVTPVNGTSYNVGDALGTGQVIGVGTGTTFSSTLLTPSTQYTYYVYSYDNTSACAGPHYLATTPLSGSQTTLSCAPLAAGTYSVGPTGTYTTLGAALSATSGGTSGNVIFELQNTYSSAVETFPITFAMTPCPTVGNITVRPQAGATGLSIASANTTATLDFNGGDKFIIDGRPGGVGTTSQLSIINTSTSGVAVRFINDAQSNTLTYLDIQGQNTASPATGAVVSAGVVYFSTAFVAPGFPSLGNDNNTISNCSIHSTAGGTPAIGIFSIGTSTSTTSYTDSIIVSNNNIYDFFSAGSASTGIKVDGGNNAWTISGNNFYQTATRTYTTSNTHRGIWLTPNTASIANTASGFIITGNSIGGTAPSAGGTAYTMGGTVSNVFLGMDLSVGHGTPTTVQNNTISNFAITTASTANPYFAGISVANGHVNIGTVTGNTIGSGTGAGAISLTTTGSGGTSYGIRLAGGTSTMLNCSNNTIGSITITNSASTNFVGIGAVGGTTTNVSITNNTIGSTTTANSINLTGGGTTTSQGLTGIQVSSGAAISTVTGNTVANLRNAYSSTGTAGQSRGIAVSTGATTITNNTIWNLSNAATQTGTGSSSALLGISMTTTTAAVDLSGNTIHSLIANGSSTSAAIQLTGIFFSGTTAGASTLARNFVHSFDVTAVNTGATMTGIDFAAGNASLINNMIRLGIRPDGSAMTNAQVVRGISSNSSSSLNNIYHNSIYIGGTGVGTTTSNSYAFIRTSTSGAYDIRNNIFSNVRSNATTGGKHFAVFFTTSMAGVNIDYNVYQYSGTGGVFANNGTADVAAYTSGWTASDVHSIAGDPLFANATGTASTVDLHLTSGSIAEGTGLAIGSVTDDFDSQTRSGLTPTDIGADAGNYGATGVDMGAVLLVSPVAGGCGSATQSVIVRIRNFSSNTINFATNPVTVTVTATGPVAYNSNIIINAGTLASGATLDVTLPATINTTAPGTYTFNANTSVTGDATAGNDAMSVQNVIVTAGATLAGTYTVGASGNFPTLTAAIAAYNTAACLSGNVVFSLIDPLYSTNETFPDSIKHISNPNNYTLTIVPASGVNAIISGAVASGALIKLYGADNVIIDGSNNGTSTRNLTITNTSTTSPTGIAVISLGTGAGANNNVIKNINVSTPVTTSTGYGIAAGGSTAGTAGADNDNLTIQNNEITNATVGIYAVGTLSTSTGGNDNLLITGNTITNTTSTLTLFGIQVGNGLNSQVSQNAISLETSGTSPVGISLETGFTSSSVAGNNITKVLTTNTGGWGGRGITVGTGVTNSNLTIANNFISGINGSNWTAFGNSSSMGIAIGMIGSSATITTVAGGVNIYHNTVNLYGPYVETTSTITTALYVGSGATNINVRNNVFVNNLINTDPAGTGAKSYAIYSAAPASAYAAIDYNDYFAGGVQGRLGFLGTDLTTLAAIQAAFGGNANSLNIQPSFNSNSDLHMDIALSAALDNKGTPVGITTDIDGDVRSATTPDIGADEFAVVTGIDFGVKSLVNPVIKQCYSTTETVSVRIRNYSANTHNFATVPVTVHASATGPNPQVFTPVVVNTGTLAPGDSLLVVITNTYNMSALGTYTFSAYTTVSADVQALNDTMDVVTRTLSATQAGVVTASNSQFCLTGTPSLTLTGSNGSTIQWQSAPGATGPWTNVGTNSNTFTPGSPITATTYYRAYVVCNANSDTSNVQTVTVNNPQLLTTTPATRCGPGTVNLSATGSAGATFNWYTSATGGAPIFVGSPFTTPIINNTTTYYVAASTGGGGVQSVGAPNLSIGAAAVVGTYYMNFTVLAPTTIQSVNAYFSTVGAPFVLNIRDAATLASVFTYSGTTTVSGTANAQTIPINATLPPGNYQMGWTTDPGTYRVSSGASYPYTIPGVISITGNTFNDPNFYYYFFAWQVVTGCESPRQPVTATVTTAPAFNITDSLTVCNNAITQLQVTSPLANFDTYVWTPVAGLFTNATATTAYTAGTNASTVYERIATPGSYTFIAQANNTTTGCQNFDSVKVTVLPAAITVVPSPDQICVSGTSTLTILPNPVTYGQAQYQWQSSPNNTTYTNIAGATSSSYTTPTITATTYYKVDLKNSAGVSCTTAYDTVIVNSPAILSSTPAALCGPGTMTLTATATPGATINWYTTPVGGAPVASGSPFTTPNLTATQTYYVAATTGTGGADVGIKVAEFPICGTPTTSSTLDYPIRFTTTKTIVINSAWVIPTTTNLTIALRAQGSTANIATMSYTFTAGQVGQPQLINIGFLVTPPGAYQLTNTVGGMYRITTLGCGYPFTTPTGGFSITGSATSSTGAQATTYYNGFFQLNVSEGCESPRIPVVAQVSANTAIDQQPTPNISTCVGASINLTVGASGANLVYQWRKNGVNIPNSNNDTLTINPVALTDAGTYDVVITGLCGTAQTSQVVTVNVSAANTWTGAVSTDWNTAANWCGGIPTPTTDVAIFSGTPHQPVINATLASARNITIHPNASLTMQPNSTLAIYGDFVNNGSFVGPNGYVFFKGTANQNIAAMTIGNVVVNATGITLTGAMTVNQALVLTNGNITLGLNNLTINGDVLGTVASHVVTNSTGSLVTRAVGANQVTVPVGPSATSYNPVLIANGSGRDYAVRVATGLSPTIANPGKAVNRTWNITPGGTGTPTNVSITFQYDDAHMNTPGVPTNTMEIGVHNGTSWAVAVPSSTPSGAPAARQVGGNFSQFGPMVVTNIGGISWITSAPPPVDPTVSSVKLLPNLVETSAVLRVVSTRTANIRWNVMDGQGRTVMSFDRSVLQGQNDIQLQLQHLASGMYYLSGTTDKGTTVVVKFVKQ